MREPDGLPEDQRAVADGMSPYLRNAWYLAAWTADLPQAGLTPITILGQPVVLYHLRSGGWAALEDVCCHRLVPLSLGRQEEDCVRCLYHGLKFAADGHCVEIPGQDRIAPAVQVRAYTASECQGGVWIWMGRPDLADESLIPLVPGMDQPTYAIATACIDVESNASLVWDNLNDLSHVPFVHAGSFAGGNPAVVAAMLAGEQETSLSVTQRGVSTRKWHAGMSHSFLTQRCDDYLSSEFIAPGALLMTVRSYPAGTKGPVAGELPDAQLLWLRVASQIVTPVSESRTRIFFTIGNCSGSRELARKQLEVAKQALAEDKIFMDAQQAMMTRLPHRRPMALSMDVGVQRFRAVMKRLREIELAAAAGCS